jgi:hypothetical protein
LNNLAYATGLPVVAGSVVAESVVAERTVAERTVAERTVAERIVTEKSVAEKTSSAGESTGRDYRCKEEERSKLLALAPETTARGTFDIP